MSSQLVVASVIGKQRVLSVGQVFALKADGNNKQAYVGSVIECPVLYAPHQEGRTPPTKASLRVLHVSNSKDVAFIKKRRKRFQRKVGFCKKVCTLKVDSIS